MGWAWAGHGCAAPRERQPGRWAGRQQHPQQHKERRHYCRGRSMQRGCWRRAGAPSLQRPTAACTAQRHSAHQAGVGGAACDLCVASQDIESKCLNGCNSRRCQQAPRPPCCIKCKGQGQHSSAHGCKAVRAGRSCQGSRAKWRGAEGGTRLCAGTRLAASAGGGGILQRQASGVSWSRQAVGSRSTSDMRQPQVSRLLPGHPPLLSSVKTLLRALAPPGGPVGIVMAIESDTKVAD